MIENDPTTKINLAPSLVINSPTMVCKCGCKVFGEGFIVKNISKDLTGAKTDTFYPIPVFYCVKCGAIPDEFMKKGNAKAILGENNVVDQDSEVIS
jgi:hypothetical protein